MPKAAADLALDPFLSLLVISPSGGGKTRLMGTAPKPIYVFCSDDPSKLDSAFVNDRTFSYDEVNHTDGSKLLMQFETAIAEARRGIEAGKYASIVWDTITMFSNALLNAELNASDDGKGADGRRAYDNYGRRMINCVSRFLSLKANRIVMAHFYEQSKEMDGQLKKHGEGILPGIAGKARQVVPGMFHDVVFLRKKADSDERELALSISGVYGPRFVGLPGVEKVPADLTALLAQVREPRSSKAAKAAPPAPAAKVPAKPALAAKPSPAPASAAKPAQTSRTR
jgi:AAA domain